MIFKLSIEFVPFLEYFIIAGSGIIIALMVFIAFGSSVKERTAHTEKMLYQVFCSRVFSPKTCNQLDIEGDNKVDCVWDLERGLCRARQ